MSDFDITTPLEVTRKLLTIQKEVATDSLPEYTTPARLTPIVLIDNELLSISDDSLANVLQTITSIYSAHYIMAMSIATNVNNVDTMALLDKFSTSRDIRHGGVGSGWEDKMTSLESIDSKLPMYDSMTLEDGGYDKRNSDDLQEHGNLAIGRLLHITVGVGKDSIVIPVNVVINPKVINSDDLPNILANIDVDTGYTARYHKWRSGEIKSVIDYLFALDLIENDKKALLTDKSGIFKEARFKKAKGVFNSVITGNVSINNASTMAVISKSTADNLEIALKGKLKNSRVRMGYFKTTNSMLLAVVDARKERIKIYQRGISEVGMYTFTDIQKASKNSGAMDINSILKAYKLGDSPSL